MNAIRPTLLLLFILLGPCLALTQTNHSFTCGFDDLRRPNQAKAFEALELQLQTYLANKKAGNNQENGLSSSTFTVPVVVHIVHNGGPENIPDAQVLAAIDHLNAGFAATGYYAQLGATVNTQIQFCLAKRDPEEQSTTGITRTQSSLTNLEMETQDLQLKDLIRWKPLDYINIWVVNEINSLSQGAGVAGYAYFPFSHGLPEDGIVCEAKYFGTSPAEDGLLIHEMGHYMGLYHTFEGGCQNGSCSFEGDRICDTPPDKATHTACPFNSCTTDVGLGSPFLTDVDDFTGDFMDYSPFPCYHFFTAGQTLRMQSLLGTARASLSESKACNEACTQAIAAGFTAVPNPVLAGETLVLTNTSSNASSYTWSANTMEFAQTLNASIVFDTPGQKLILLTAVNSDPNCDAIAFVFIDVLCPIKPGFLPSQLEAPEGSTLDFTNTSSGPGPLNYEWSINGQWVSNATDLSFQFQNSGYYTVLLKVEGPVCTAEYSTLIKIANPCGLLPEPVVVSLTAQKKLFQPRDMLALPDGSVVQCGEHFQQPMITKLDALGNLVWHREIAINGSFTEIEACPDGSFLLTADDVSAPVVVAKIDANGNLLWIKTLQNTSILYDSPRHFDPLAVNPDGTFGLIYLDEFRDGLYLSKLSADGDILWSRKTPLDGLPGSLQVATDGSGDFLFLGRPQGGFGNQTLNVYVFSQSGVLKTMHRHNLPFGLVAWVYNFILSVHSDGGYSIFFAESNGSSGQPVRKFLFRFGANGALKWGKRYNLGNGIQRFGAYIRQLPDEKGWLAVDSRRDASGAPLGDYLIRLDTSGQVQWTRHLGDTPVNDTWVMMPAYEAGNIRSVHCDFFNQDLNWVKVEDSTKPEPCVPIVPDEESISLFNITTNYPDSIPIVMDVAMVDLPYVLLDVPLTSRPLCTVVLPCPELCDNQLDDDEDGFVDCFDTDCACFSSDTSCVTMAPANNFSAKLAWQSPVDEVSVFSTPIVANLNPQQDSIPEILVLPGSTAKVYELLLFKGDGSNANNPNVLPIPDGLEGLSYATPTVADLDNNGIPEVILITTDALIRVFTDFNPAASPCMKLWAVSTDFTTNGNTRAYVADFNSDGIGEIFCGNDVFQLNLSNPAAPSLNKVLNGTGASGFLNWSTFSQNAQSPTAADLLSSNDCNGDPDCEGLEIAAGYQIYSIDLDPSDGDPVQIKVQRDLNTLVVNQIFSDGYTSIADLDLDGTPELIVSGQMPNELGFYIWNKDGLVQSFSMSNAEDVAGMITVANVYDDTKAGFAQDFPELVACFSHGITCWNLQKAQATPATPFWWSQITTDLSGFTGLSVFDFNGDGIQEIVYRDQEFLRIMYGDALPLPIGVDLERNWFKTVAGSGTADEYPVIADVDHDGEAEIAVASMLVPFASGLADGRGRLRIFESAAGKWLPARPIWNQYNYFGLNINDDLSVPKTQQKHWMEMGGVGSGKRPFNTHLAQIPSLNPATTNLLKVPDAQISLDSSICQSDSFELHLNLCNLGSAVLPGGTSIAFYVDDPTTTAASLLFTSTLPFPFLEAGDCRPLQFKIPAVYNTPLYAVINDNGSLPTPFNLGLNFPVTHQLECHYENNLISFFVAHQAPVLDLGSDLSLCNSSIVSLSAGPGFQKYRWQDGSLLPDFTAYSAGKYWVDVYDACGFKQTDTVNILLNTLANLDLPDVLEFCEGAPINLSASGFAAYQWSPADSISCSDCPSIQVNAARSFTLRMTASNNDCYVSDSVQIRIHPNPVVQFLTQDGDCESEASITPTVSGAGPFAFSWSDSSQDSVLLTLQSGTYYLETTDQFGCQSIDSAAVIDIPDLEITALTTPNDCALASNGAIDLILLFSGTAPYTYVWSNNATSEDLDHLSAGIYTVFCTDASGCTANYTETLIDPPALQTSVQAADLKCPGNSSLIDLSASGGTAPLSYFWSTAETTEDITSFQSGTYTVVVSDNKACTITDTIVLLQLGALPILQWTTDTLNCKAQTGVLSVQSNLSNTSIQWSGPGGFSANGPVAAIHEGGAYMVTVTEPLGGCTATASLWAPLDTLSPTIMLATQMAEIPCGADSITLSAAGSSSGSNYSIQWTGQNGGLLLSGNNTLFPEVGSSGQYALMITDLSNGCSATGVVQVQAFGNPLGEIRLDSLRCFGDTDAAIHVNAVSGGLPPYIYSIDNQTYSSDSIFQNLGPGTYPVSIRDSKGCTYSTQVDIQQPAAFGVALSGDTLLIQGATATVLAKLQPTSFVPTQIEWQANEMVQMQDQLELTQILLENTLFQIKVSDAQGCTATDSWLIRVEELHKIYVPNIIYPGNPSHSNQVFAVFSSADLLEIESLELFDRWGNLLFSRQHFQSNDETQGWDGNFRGSPAPAGVYVWTLKVVFKDGTKKVMGGDLTLVR